MDSSAQFMHFCCSPVTEHRDDVAIGLWAALYPCRELQPPPYIPGPHAQHAHAGQQARGQRRHALRLPQEAQRCREHDALVVGQHRRARVVEDAPDELKLLRVHLGATQRQGSTLTV